MQTILRQHDGIAAIDDLIKVTIYTFIVSVYDLSAPWPSKQFSRPSARAGRTNAKPKVSTHQAVASSRLHRSLSGRFETFDREAIPYVLHVESDLAWNK